MINWKRKKIIIVIIIISIILGQSGDYNSNFPLMLAFFFCNLFLINMMDFIMFCRVLELGDQERSKVAFNRVCAVWFSAKFISVPQELAPTSPLPLIIARGRFPGLHRCGF